MAQSWRAWLVICRAEKEQSMTYSRTNRGCIKHQGESNGTVVFIEGCVGAGWGSSSNGRGSSRAARGLSRCAISMTWMGLSTASFVDHERADGSPAAALCTDQHLHGSVLYGHTEEPRLSSINVASCKQTENKGEWRPTKTTGRTLFGREKVVDALAFSAGLQQ